MFLQYNTSRLFPRSVADRPAVRQLSTCKDFAEDFTRNHVQLSVLQRVALSAGAAVISLANPFRGDMIACLGETTGRGALIHCLQQMQSTSEGQRILDQRPRINTSTIDLSALKRLPDGTLGRSYYNFLEDNVSTLISSVSSNSCSPKI